MILRFLLLNMIFCMTFDFFLCIRHRMLPPVTLSRFGEDIRRVSARVNAIISTGEEFDFYVLPVFLSEGGTQPTQSTQPLYFQLNARRSNDGTYPSYLYLSGIYDTFDETSTNNRPLIEFTPNVNDVAYSTLTELYNVPINIFQYLSRRNILETLRIGRYRQDNTRIQYIIARAAHVYVEPIRSSFILDFVLDSLSRGQIIIFTEVQSRIITNWRDNSLLVVRSIIAQSQTPPVNSPPFDPNNRAFQVLAFHPNAIREAQNAVIVHPNPNGQGSITAPFITFFFMVLTKYYDYLHRNNNCKRDLIDTCLIRNVSYFPGYAHPYEKDQLAFLIKTLEDCEQSCYDRNDCTYYTWRNKECILKTGKIVMTDLTKTNDFGQFTGIRKDAIGVKLDGIQLHTFRQFKSIPTIIKEEDCWKQCVSEADCIASNVYWGACNLFDRSMFYSRDPTQVSYFYPSLLPRPRIINNLRLKNHYRYDPTPYTDDECWNKCLSDKKCVASMFSEKRCYLYDKDLSFELQNGFRANFFTTFPTPYKSFKGIQLYNHFDSSRMPSSDDSCWQYCLKISNCLASLFSAPNCFFYNNLVYQKVSSFTSYISLGTTFDAKKVENIRLYNHYKIDTSKKDTDTCFQSCVEEGDCVASLFVGVCFLYARNLKYIRETGYTAYLANGFDLEPKNAQNLMIHDNPSLTNNKISTQSECWRYCVYSLKDCLAAMIKDKICYLYNQITLYKRYDSSTVSVAPLYKYNNANLYFIYQYIRLTNHFTIFSSSDIKTPDDCFQACLFDSKCVAASYRINCFLYDRSLKYVKDSQITGSRSFSLIEINGYTKLNKIRLWYHYKEIDYNDKTKSDVDCFNECFNNRYCEASLIFNNVWGNRLCGLYDSNLKWSNEEKFDPVVPTGFNINNYFKK